MAAEERLGRKLTFSPLSPHGRDLRPFTVLRCAIFTKATQTVHPDITKQCHVLIRVLDLNFSGHGEEEMFMSVLRTLCELHSQKLHQLFILT